MTVEAAVPARKAHCVRVLDVKALVISQHRPLVSLAEFLSPLSA